MLCKSTLKLLHCKRNFVSQNVLGPLLQKPPNTGAQMIIFLIAQAGAIFCFISVDILAKNVLTWFGGIPSPGALKWTFQR